MGEEGSLLVSRHLNPPHCAPHLPTMVHHLLLLPKGQTMGHCLEAEDLIFEVSLTRVP